MVSPFQRDPDRVQVAAAGPVSTHARVPGSKSLTNRYLLLAGLAQGRSELVNPLASEDTEHMRAALAAVGVAVRRRDPCWLVDGAIWQDPVEPVFVGNAGTVMRFFTTALAATGCRATVAGNPRMAVRPIGDLVDGLRGLGALVTYAGQPGFPPLTIERGMSPGSVAIRGDASSQYLSGLLMALPLLPGDSHIRITSTLVSRTYVAMTLDCMARMGVTAQADDDWRTFRIPGKQRYRPAKIGIEPDASTASYWLALPLMVGGSVTLANVPAHSHQGDFGLLDIFAAMGAGISRSGESVTLSAAPLRGVEVDMNSMSDVAPTLAVVATRAATPTTIHNIHNMRIKECDRIETIQRAFDALGLRMESGRDWMKIYPGKPARPALLDPQEDHRMAMIFTLLGLAYGGVTIRDPDCVAKTYPGFYEDLATAWAD